jgi:anti-sigma B factor antagonist
MLVVNIQNFGATTVFRCIGRIVAGEEVAALKTAVLCHQDSNTVILDLSQVSALDGAGMGLLAFLAGWTRVMGIQFKVMNPTAHVRRLLELTNLDSVLEICDRESADESIRAVMPAATESASNIVAQR